MWLSNMEMALISLAPSLAICVFVYFRDRKEKEPLRLLALLFVVSAVVYIPVYYLGELVSGIFDNAFSSQRTLSLATGMTMWSSAGAKAAHHALCAFISVGLLEEVSRWLILYFITSKSKHFDCLFDGVVYSVFVSMGAALANNVRLAFESGWELFLLKLVSSFPWYLFFGIVMGILYTAWHTKRGADKKENSMIENGALKNDKIKYPVLSLVSSILVPALLHGLYSFVTMVKMPGYNLLFGAVIVIMMIVCVLLIYFLSKKDKTKKEVIDDMIKEKHGDASAEGGDE